MSRRKRRGFGVPNDGDKNVGKRGSNPRPALAGGLRFFLRFARSPGARASSPHRGGERPRWPRSRRARPIRKQRNAVPRFLEKVLDVAWSLPNAFSGAT